MLRCLIKKYEGIKEVGEMEFENLLTLIEDDVRFNADRACGMKKTA